MLRVLTQRDECDIKERYKSKDKNHLFSTTLCQEIDQYFFVKNLCIDSI